MALGFAFVALSGLGFIAAGHVANGAIWAALGVLGLWQVWVVTRGERSTRQSRWITRIGIPVAILAGLSIVFLVRAFDTQDGPRVLPFILAGIDVGIALVILIWGGRNIR